MSESIIRAPIAVIMGHVDSGKTSLLDKVRKTVVQAREAGGITQHIGASLFPKETIVEIASKIGRTIDLKTPGILIIDTPGHEAFMTLRTRGASVADIAIVVVDLTKGFQAQTYESIETLRRQKVPFVIAANKMDRVGGWEAHKDESFIASYNKQHTRIQQRLDEEIYKIMGELSQMGLESDKYNNIRNFTKKVAIIPTSATSGEGVSDLFMVIAGLTQQYMMKKLTYADGAGEGVIIEVKEETGLGTTINVILFNGNIKQHDTIVIAGKDGPITTKIRSILQPKPLDEMRDARDKFDTPETIWASAGLKITAPNLNNALSGGAMYVARSEKEIKQKEKMISDELASIKVSTQKEGILIKTDTLGSLEALTSLLKERGIPIRFADVGSISRKDVVNVSIMARNNPEFGAILGFNVKVTEDAEELAFAEGVEIFQDPIIYRMIDGYIEWMDKIVMENNVDNLAELPKPTKIKHIPEYVFRNNKPMVIGVKILTGEVRPKDVLINKDNQRIGTIQQVRLQNEAVHVAKAGDEVAISVRGPTYGRQVKEGDEMYIDLRATHALKLMTKYLNELPPVEKEILTEIEKIKKTDGLRFWPYTG
ncbi:MAG: translation initiation factor IF-2 [Candidatus Heimdallarchaeota archaeon]|nr:translation initiation factor IF-2 [Candidatus Heimdallarchaeota archaeon]